MLTLTLNQDNQIVVEHRGEQLIIAFSLRDERLRAKLSFDAPKSFKILRELREIK